MNEYRLVMVVVRLGCRYGCLQKPNWSVLPSTLWQIQQEFHGSAIQLAYTLDLCGRACAGLSRRRTLRPSLVVFLVESKYGLGLG